MSLPDLLIERAVGFIPVLLSLTVHEWAHAWTALRLGDDTAKMLGRVSLNPLDHIDPVGTLLLPLLGVPFGWAKPVPVNPSRFRTNVRMSTGMLLVAVAGPISNVILAMIGCAALALFSRLANPVDHAALSLHTYAAITALIQSFVLINIILALFNLLPIPPLDGSRIADALMPDSLRPLWENFVGLGPILLAAVILLPYLSGTNIFRLPIQWAGELLTWVTGK
jgi:Zn-dependent protease